MSKRDQRQPHPPAMRLTERDIAILQAIYDYRVLSTPQLQTLFFGSLVKTRARLNLLYHHRLIDRKFSGLYFAKMNTPILHVLDRRGADILSQLGTLRHGWHRKSKQVGGFFLEHTLAINTVRVAVVKACQDLGVQLVEWRSENDLKTSYDRVTLPTNTKPTAVIPDGYFVLDTPKGLTHFFLELDRATETNAIFKRKVAAYQVYRGSQLVLKRFGTSKFRVLTVTTSAARLKHLVRTTSASKAKHHFWFTTLNKVTPEAMLTNPIWQIPGSVSPQALLAGSGVDA